MLLSLDTGVSALDQFQQDLNVVGNNIANVNTVGFKEANMEFSDTLSQTVGTSAAGPDQVGTGVQTGSIVNAFTQGTFTNTAVPSNVAINGNGFFVVKDPASGEEYVTRDGDFTVNSSGDLVTSSGMNVQGYTAANGATGTTIGNLQVSNTVTGSTASVQSYTIGTDGTINLQLSDGTEASGGQILMQNFTAPTQLQNVGGNLYSGLTSAGELAAPVAPGTSGTGTLVAGSLEMSNVDLTDQLAALIIAQRGFEANSETVTTSNDILQDLVNLKH